MGTLEQYTVLLLRATLAVSDIRRLHNPITIPRSRSHLCMAPMDNNMAQTFKVDTIIKVPDPPCRRPSSDINNLRPSSSNSPNTINLLSKAIIARLATSVKKISRSSECEYNRIELFIRFRPCFVQFSFGWLFEWLCDY
jgi:hypothetical protein